MKASAGRLVGGGLALAAATILALAVLVLAEIERESRLYRDVLAQLEAGEHFDNLRMQLTALANASRIAALTNSAESYEVVQGLSTDIEAELDALGGRARGDPRFSAVQPVAESARLAVLNARSIEDVRRTRGDEAADAAAREAERLAGEAGKVLERTLEHHAARINKQTLTQLRVGDALRTLVGWSLAGSMLMLLVLFALYRAARRREAAALARIERMAHFDAVSGLPNRALLTDRLQREVARAHRSERPFALLSFDLDGFKAVNDTWGHAAGDRALRIVAERAQQAMRASDTVGRMGGDEFLALLPETALVGALHVAEKLRGLLSQPYPLGVAEATMSASIGVALFPAHGSDAEALHRAADEALYEAKREGKNRVCVASRGVAAEGRATAP